jgi:large subunit ribosomal protein L2
MRHRGGGHKRKYRFIDWKRDILDEAATVVRLEYDPNRTAHLALIRYPDGLLRYILAPQDLNPGDTVQASRSQQLDIRLGNAMPLYMMPAGTVVHNVEMWPGKGGQMARSAGASCRVVDKEARPGFVLLELASKEQRFVLENCMATIGSLTNPLHAIENLGKAGRSRHRGWRPHVRACAMNPVDHPLGGGYNSKGRQPCSPTGVLAKGFKTVRVKNPLIVVERGGVNKVKVKE